MANYKAVDADKLDADLTIVADAIRDTSGTTEKMVFPGGFASAVSELCNPVDYLAAVCNKAATEIINPKISGVLCDRFQQDSINLTKVDLPGVTEMGTGCFNFCSNLEEINFSSVAKIGSSCFESCHKITEWYFPSLETISGWGWVFASCRSVTKAYYPKLQSITGPKCWSGNVSLETFILGADTVCTLSSADVFSDTPIGGNTTNTEGRIGYIYVPSTLVDSYKSATNWSTYADQIRAIEDYPEVLEGWE